MKFKTCSNLRRITKKSTELVILFLVLLHTNHVYWILPGGTFHKKHATKKNIERHKNKMATEKVFSIKKKKSKLG